MNRIKYIGLLAIILLGHFYCQRDFDNPVDTDVSLDEVKNLVAEQEGEWIRLSWIRQDLITGGYELERKAGDQPYKRLKLIEDPNITTYLDTTIATNNSYNYRIRGYSDKNFTLYTAEIMYRVHFPAPYGLHYQIISDSSITVSWQDSASFESAFMIERNSSLDTVWQVIGQTKTDSTEIIDNGLSYNTDYTYRIRALTSANTSAYSGRLAVKIYLAAPHLESVNPINDHQMRIEWSENITFESGFIIERSQNYAMEWHEVGRVDENVTIFLDDSLKVQNNYSYRIRAFSIKNSSEYSNQLSAQTFFPAPAHLAISSWTQNSIVLKWDDLEFEEGYTLKHVAKGQMDTVLHTLAQNTTSYQITDVDTSFAYVINIQGVTTYNRSLPSEAEIKFIQQANLQHSFLAHADTVLSLSFSNEGQSLASGGADSDVKIWAVDTWSHIKTITGGAIEESVKKLAFVASDAYLVVGYHYSYLKLFEAPSWNFYQDINPVNYPLNDISQVDAIGKFAVAKYKFIYVWNTSSWSLEKTFTAANQAVYGMVYDTNGDWLASSNGDGIKIWETANWSVIQTLTEHSGAVLMLNTSANGQWLASGSRDHTIIIWDTDNWNSVATLTGHTNDVVLLSFTMNNSWLASVEKGDNRICIWSTQNWQKEQTLQLTSPGEISSIAFSPDTRFLLAGDANGKIWIWQFAGSWVLSL